MNQVLSAFGLLDFTMSGPVIAGRAFWNLWTVYFFNFSIFFSGRGKPRIRGSACLVYWQQKLGRIWESNHMTSGVNIIKWQRTGSRRTLRTSCTKIQYVCYWIKCCSPKRPDRLWGSIISLFDRTGASFSEVKLSGPEGDHTSLPSEELNNA